jgi:predicted PurR-regulated permease PerM
MFVNGNIWGGIGALITWGAITLIRRVIEPPILGTAMSLHPMATLFSMIVGIAVYGLGGVLIGPVILVIVKEVFTQFEFDIKLRQIIGNLLNRVIT